MTKSAAITALSDLIKNTIANCESDLEKSEARALISAILDDLLKELPR